MAYEENTEQILQGVDVNSLLPRGLPYYNILRAKLLVPYEGRCVAVIKNLYITHGGNYDNKHKEVILGTVIFSDVREEVSPWKSYVLSITSNDKPIMGYDFEFIYNSPSLYDFESGSLDRLMIRVGEEYKFMGKRLYE